MLGGDSLRLVESLSNRIPRLASPPSSPVHKYNVLETDLRIDTLEKHEKRRDDAQEAAYDLARCIEI